MGTQISTSFLVIINAEMLAFNMGISSMTTYLPGKVHFTWLTMKKSGGHFFSPGVRGEKNG